MDDLPLPDLTPAEIPDMLPAPVLALATNPVVREAPPRRPSVANPRPSGPTNPNANAASPAATTRPSGGASSPGPASLFTGGGSGRFPLPPYPAEAKRRGLEGRVMLRVAVGPDGKPGTPAIESGSGHPVLDRAAIDWIQRRWRWEAGPARLFRIPVIFQLQ
jgi:protein TonB